MKLRTYKKEFGYSYALGASLVIELLQNRPEDCIVVIFSPAYPDKGGRIAKLCEKYNIPIEENQKFIDMLSPKENCYALAAFSKRERQIGAGKSHVILDSPSDMGNLGAVIRSCAGFGINDVAIVGGGADVFNPKAIRASMGAFFHINAQYFDSITDYLGFFGGNRGIYTFMLGGDHNLADLPVNKNEIYSLVFGNEASGLDYDTYKNIGKSVVIGHSGKIDSLSLPTAAGIALFWFAK